MTTWKAPLSAPHHTVVPAPWSTKRINKWYNNIGLPVGCNYIPFNAINQLEMWQAESFDLAVISRELGWAVDLGFNTVRVFLHHLCYDQDSAGFIGRIDQFLATADKHGIKTMFVLFDAVWDPFPKAGKQPEPKAFVHNSGWVQCPGFDILNDTSRHEELFGYVHGIVNHFKNDERVLIWDVFNEPDNMNIASYKDDAYSFHKAGLSMQLLKKAITWIRAIDPIQPLTMAPWQYEWHDPALLTELDNFMFTQADIISFHCYENKDGMEKRIKDLKRYGRPMLCTEYMARPFSSTFKDILPLFKKYKVGGYNWGFVAGKSQTHCAWDSWQTPPEKEPEHWFHDIFTKDGTPYCHEEVAFLKTFNQTTLKVSQRSN